MQNLPLHLYSAFQDAEQPEVLLRGFQKYLSAEYDFDTISFEVVKQLEETSLRYYPATEKSSNFIFIIPSLINGPEIFDLCSDQSFIRYMNEQNYNVYMLEWGDLSENYDLSLEELLQGRLATLWQYISKRTQDIHILGYCLGGTLTASFFALNQSSHLPSSITFLATPFDFHLKHTPWDYVLNNTEIIKTQVTQQSALTQRMLHAHFLKRDPAYIIQKFETFLNMDVGSREEQLFIAVEHWLNNGFDLPYKLSMDLIETYFVENKSIQELPKLLNIEMAFIASKKDMIVPHASACAVKENAPNIYEIKTSCGHVGMMAGRSARQTVWQPYIEFIERIAMQQT